MLPLANDHYYIKNFINERFDFHYGKVIH